MRREWSVISVALSPLRALERSRGWRRLGILAVYTLIALVIWAIMWRRAQLASLPDIGDPFEAAGIRSPVPVSDERNAAVPYRAAAKLFRDLNNGAESTSFTNANLAWSRADATMRAWVAEHDKAISLLIDGSTRPEFYFDMPNVSAIEARAERVELARRMGWIGTAGLFKAGQLQAQGDCAGAWSILKGIVRANRHMEWCITRAQDRAWRSF